MAQNIPTIRGSFQVALPSYQNNGDPSPSVSASGESTRAMDPPKFAQSVQPNIWAATGTTWLTTIPPNTTAIDVERIAAEDTFAHRNEGDVVRAAALHLLHPVHQAFSARNGIGNTYRCQSEFTHQKVRGDITYYKNTQQGPRQCAVIEFKKRGSIRPTEFLAAVKCNQPPSAQQTQNFVQAAYASRNTDYTFFTDNSRILIKQAASYAVAHQIRCVALFDYDFLVFVEFNNVTANAVGDYCETTIIPVANNTIVRPALLAFLAHAYNQF
ncbi:hypothetical protein KVR01_010544 [Diaporthe batatas]|uniref:uncharacterized protein n=1 Tax=Diaporthe batatas TaxID=748121 RepID=UPI001D0551FC|nr:uncharacterized protein KVR01_010544 [Diaporthe batatas]KAG8159907.1 hypothetical protein KVR01_010544 [Diaporthe batatas]